MIDDDEMRALAATQHGLVSVEQAGRLIPTRATRSELVDGRRWQRVPSGVYRLVGSADTEAQRLMGAVLAAGPGAALNGNTAAAHWGVRGAVLLPINVVRPRDRADRRGAGIPHEPTLLPADHVVTLDGIPVVLPARALFDIAGSERRGAEKPWWIEKVDRLVNNALTDGLVSAASLHGMLRRMAQRGRPGIRVMREVLAEVGPGYVATGSGLETRVVHLCKRGGIPAMRRQVNLGDAERWIGRVDFLDREVPFVLEVQSHRFHRSRIDSQLDATRIDRLDAAGFEVEQVFDEDVWYRPELVLETIRAGRARAAVRFADLAA